MKLRRFDGKLRILGLVRWKKGYVLCFWFWALHLHGGPK